MKKISLFLIISLLMISSTGYGEDDPIAKLKDETMSFFSPIRGVITQVDNKEVIMRIDTKYTARRGMRARVLREGALFTHPVTKEVLGKTETILGKVEIRDVKADSAFGIMLEGDAKEGDKIRISETKIRMLFCQDKNVEWYLADDLYRKLKATGRIEMIDTALETGDESRVIEEAQRLGAEVALILTAKEIENSTLLKEKLFWVSDRSGFVDLEAKIDIAFVKELKFGGEMFTPRTGEAVLAYDLPFNARFVATGDFDGDGKQEIAMSNGKDANVYLPALDLQFLWQAKGSAYDDHIWIDAIDLNKNSRDELIITSMKGNEVVSYIYELSGTEFKKLWEEKYFLRKLGTRLIAQAYSGSEGFSKNIYDIVWNGQYSKGEKIKLPDDVNIYDFVYIEGAGKENMVFAYDDKGFLNLYNEQGIKTWRSASDTGGFITSFKKPVTTVYMEQGEWSIKDRLVQRNKEVLTVKRIPMSDMAKSVGYKNSQIKNYWWNGVSMEEGTLIDNIRGSVRDYALAGDKLLVVSNPFLGIKFGNILKGENPLVAVLYIYSIKGR